VEGKRYDVVVVGAGSSGGTVAARLSEDSGCDVLLVEAGPDFPDEHASPPEFVTGGALFGEGGAGSGAPVPDLDWNYMSEEIADGRRVPLRRGKLVGGTSMINGCIAVRGRPEDFERWVASGAIGWDWETVVPYYEAVEREIAIRLYPEELWLPIQRTFLEACLEIGFRYAEDFNAPDAWDGVVGPWPRNRRNEIRQGSLVTYIRAARGRPNFTIVDRALVERVVHDGRRATGIVYVDGDGRRQSVSADRVVLSAGAYGSAPILLRSGVGPAAELRALGIEAAVDLPVGRGLLEHPGYRFLVSLSTSHARGGWPGLAVAARGDGWWAIPGVFDEEREIGWLGFFLGLVDRPDGRISLASTAPDTPPLIDHGYRTLLSGHAFDGVWHDFGRLLATEALREAGVADLDPDTRFADRLRDGIGTGTHPAGGCQIGLVVDPKLDLYGIDGLTVADASVFPRHVTNNPNLTCHMVGEVAAATIRGTGAPGLTRQAHEGPLASPSPSSEVAFG
jgi:choline dehydrogenase